MSNLNLGSAQNTFDAIVIGSGITGGWAAKELSQKGLKTLVLERGRNVEHVKDAIDVMGGELDNDGIYFISSVTDVTAVEDKQDK